MNTFVFVDLPSAYESLLHTFISHLFAGQDRLIKKQTFITDSKCYIS